MNRRDFLKGTVCATAATAAASAVSGCRTAGGPLFGGGGETMFGFAAPKLDKVRIGYIGLGNRGPAHFYTMTRFLPWCEMRALCDMYKDRVDWRCDWVVEQKNQTFRPEGYWEDENAWKKVCERDDVDVIFINTPWKLHAPMAEYAMRCGKHACVEVPAALTVEECWRLVNASEETRRHCIMLENCCYGENELFMLSLAHKGLLGDLVHGECGYLHDLAFAKLNTAKNGYYKRWRLEYSHEHNGNAYPTHGLGPIAQMMDINHGDRFKTLVSLSSDVFRLPQRAAEMFAEGSPERDRAYYRQGDVSTALIKTCLGRTIMVQHDTSLPRPYSRINSLYGTKGCCQDYPFRMALLPNSHEWMKDDAVAELKKKYLPDLWQKDGKEAKERGGHGGMDYLMNLDITRRLRDGLPMTMDVYDAAAWSCLCEFTERSTEAGGKPIAMPDFTRGKWKDAKPLFS